MRVMQEVMTKERFMLMSQGLLFICDFHTYYHTITIALEMTPLVLKKISEINFEEMDDLAASYEITTACKLCKITQQATGNQTRYFD